MQGGRRPTSEQLAQQGGRRPPCTSKRVYAYTFQWVYKSVLVSSGLCLHPYLVRSFCAVRSTPPDLTAPNAVIRVPEGHVTQNRYLDCCFLSELTKAHLSNCACV